MGKMNMGVGQRLTMRARVSANEELNSSPPGPRSIKEMQSITNDQPKLISEITRLYRGKIMTNILFFLTSVKLNLST